MNRLLVAFIVLAVFTSNPARAEEKFWPWPLGWTQDHWDHLDFERRLEHTARTPHNAQWAQDPAWTPKDWADARGGARNVVRGFYAADILVDQDLDDDMPVIEVGEGYVRLSPQDKRRFAAFMDDAFGITVRARKGGFQIIHACSGQNLGYYSASGLQLQ